MRYWIVMILFFGLSACASLKAPQELQAGKMSFEEGDYPKAFHQLLPLAANGNKEAEYAVGYLYYYGYGTPQNVPTGLFWMKRSADQGYEPAKRALATIASQ